MTKLKGKSTKVKKAKKTLKIMKENRKKDSIHLRTIIEAKLKWAENEEKNSLENIEKFKRHILKIQGAILFMKDILEPKKEQKKE